MKNRRPRAFPRALPPARRRAGTARGGGEGPGAGCLIGGEDRAPHSRLPPLRVGFTCPEYVWGEDRAPHSRLPRMPGTPASRWRQEQADSGGGPRYRPGRPGKGAPRRAESSAGSLMVSADLQHPPPPGTAPTACRKLGGLAEGFGPSARGGARLRQGRPARRRTRLPPPRPSRSGRRARLIIIEGAARRPVRVRCDADGVGAAADAVRRGGVVAFPTDTVYGLGCDPLDASAVARVYGIKGRPSSKPLPVLGGSRDDLTRIADLGGRRGALASRFWPGPLTVLAPSRGDLLAPALAPGGVVAVRVPAGRCVGRLLGKCGLLAGTSANPSGGRPSTDPGECFEAVGELVDVFVDGGAIEGPGPGAASAESTVVEVDAREGRLGLRVAREGRIGRDDIAAALRAAAGEEGAAAAGEEGAAAAGEEGAAAAGEEGAAAAGEEGAAAAGEEGAAAAGEEGAAAGGGSMRDGANLAVTCPRHFEDYACEEISRILGRMGDAAPRARRSGMPGIVLVRTSADPAAVSRYMRGLLREEPWSVRYALRTIPLQRWVKADPDSIVACSAELAGGIGEGQSYRVSVKKRNSRVSSQDLVRRIADSVIGGRVSLEDPDRTILVEIFGPRAGVSLVSDGDVLSVDREKRRMSE